MTMKYLVLDGSNEIVEIVEADTAPAGATAKDVPDDYPELMHWDSAAMEFVEDEEKIDIALKTEIDAQFTEVVRGIISDLPGQPRRYQKKYEEATAFLDAVLPVATDYPFLNAEAGASGMTLLALATEIKAVGDQWTAIEISLEANRTATKRAIEAANTLTAKKAAAVIDWAAVVSGT